MKTNNTIKALTATLLLVAAQSGAQAASLLANGDFDSLPVGTAPDVGRPAGRWRFDPSWPEATPSQFSIVPAPGGGTGNCVQLLGFPEYPAFEPDLINMLTRSVSKASGQIINVSFDIYVASGCGGGDVDLARGPEAAERGPMLRWFSNGSLGWRNSSAQNITLFSYPRGVWQTVRLEVNLARDRLYRQRTGTRSRTGIHDVEIGRWKAIAEFRKMLWFEER